MPTCCSQDFHTGNEVIRSTDSRIGIIYRIKPAGVCDAILVKWIDTGKIEGFFNQQNCNVFSKTGN